MCFCRQVVIGAVLNGVGMAVKGISTWDLVTPPDLRYTVTMIGSVRIPPPNRVGTNAADSVRRPQGPRSGDSHITHRVSMEKDVYYN